MTRTVVLALALSLGSIAAACSKAAPPAPAPSATVPASAPSPSAAAPEPTATASGGAPSASAPAPDAPPTASAAPPVTASAAAPSRAPTRKAAAALTCGDKPLPPCPLYAWMKANTSAAMSAQNFDAMATALDKVVTFAPAGYPNWASIARDGASAARSQNYDGVRASCRGCHNQYKDKYKKEMRDRAL